MVITLDLNLVNNNTDNKIQEAYNKEVDLSEIFYYNLNKIEIPNTDSKGLLSVRCEGQYISTYNR